MENDRDTSLQSWECLTLFLPRWILIFAGPKPFTLDEDGDLSLAFEPALPKDMFKEDGTASFVFLGAVDVTYVNANKADAWKTTVTKMVLKTSDDDDGGGKTVKASALSGDDAKDVRDLKYAAIDVHLA